MLLPVFPCTPPAITIQAKPESGPHTILLAVAGVPTIPGSEPTRSAAPTPRSVRPFDHIGACYVAYVPADPVVAAAESAAQSMLATMHREAPAPAASSAPRP